ncbi:MAG: uridine kinase [Acutalibacteraceae bacterium]
MPKFTVDGINDRINENADAFIDDCENAYRKSLEKVRDKIISSSGRKLVMLAGPSSSGKTTTAGLIRSLVAQSGRNAITISLDDFYKDQRYAPKFDDGSPDFETVHALDIEKIDESLETLIRTGSASLPEFDFKTRTPRDNAKKVEIGDNDIVIVEGLHALNPLITDGLENEDMIKLYVSVSSRVYKDGKVYFTKRDIRFIRRMIRDYQFRSSPVDFTFYLWKGVRTGEDRYLFPFRDRADIKIDSIHPYELCVYKELATDLLGHIKSDSVYYNEAQTYIEKLNKLQSLEKSRVPDNSLLHEFLG